MTSKVSRAGALIGSRPRRAVDGAARQTIIMSDTTRAPEDENEPAYHLYLDEQEVPVATVAMRLLISDEAHEPQIRQLAREVVAGLEGAPDERGTLIVALSPEQMKIAYSAVRLLLNDLQREQAGEREVLRAILDKLPDEHTMRAIELP